MSNTSLPSSLWKAAKRGESIIAKLPVITKVMRYGRLGKKCKIPKRIRINKAPKQRKLNRKARTLTDINRVLG